MSDESLGGDISEINERALTAVADFIHSVSPGDMVQRFVLVVETIDSDDRWLSAFTAPAQKRWDTMGLLEYAMTMERNVTFDGVVDDRDEEDD